MKRLSYVFGATLLSGAALAQTFTTSGVTGSGVTATGISVAGVLEGVTVAGSATYNLVGLGTGFNRYDVRAISTRNVGSFSTLETAAPTASTTVPGIATRTLTSTGTANSASNTDWYIGQSGSTFAISASAMRDESVQPRHHSQQKKISGQQTQLRDLPPSRDQPHRSGFLISPATQQLERQRLILATQEQRLSETTPLLV